MKILVVDDSKVMRSIVTKCLRQAFDMSKHSVVEAGNGKEGLQVVKDSCPDLVLSDWNMPEMNGIDLLAAVKNIGYKGHSR